ncbi:MAG: porin [Ginsengibacter sp.]
MRCSLVALLIISTLSSRAQFLMDLVDTTKEIGKSVLDVSQRFNHIRIGGYMQPQFQLAQDKGAKSYIGGDFPPNVNNRFTLRRGRIRFDYVRFNKTNKASVQLVFQFDGTERGVFIRDFWGRVFENKFQLFSFSAGMFARPFSYELNLSSSDRESPERGRMSQILMKTERDLGIMISFEPRKPSHPLRYLKIDAGLFNGQGLAASADFDSHKDFITRVGLKPYSLGKKLIVSAAASYLDGGLLQSTKYIYTTNSATKNFTLDSSAVNVGRIAPRKYYGADAQLKIKCKAGFTEFRAEYITGKQTGTAVSSETPAVLPDAAGSYYIRKFDGAYFYFLQNFISPAHQFIIKYDWYDPNTTVSKKDIGQPGSNLNATDIKYSTLGIGYIHYINENLKLVLWYDKVFNEKTLLPGATSDIKDDIFTCRMQFRF